MLPIAKSSTWRAIVWDKWLQLECEISVLQYVPAKEPAHCHSQNSPPLPSTHTAATHSWGRCAFYTYTVLALKRTAASARNNRVTASRVGLIAFH
ncbi:hypothetical protein Baya_11028 [Bagarius yarrelli]|uniref:Uncharacterized protein n=1 Tax=Bagarius yarrelli TaxID=175774 RepID=A0A556UYY9_BAGYA|nr:hypothetical protein Baya_11028 [Bagarius yarrelli]